VVENLFIDICFPGTIVIGMKWT